MRDAFIVIALAVASISLSQPSGEANPPKPADPALTIYPDKIQLRGADDNAQLILSGIDQQRPVDRTTDAEYSVADEKIAKVTPKGRVIPKGNGTTQVTAKVGDKSATVQVTVEKHGDNLPINFANQVVPIFTKLGCNAGGCHGKASGQNGFRLSLLGFEPEVDYNAIVKEGRGRRLFPASPENSLFLLKATGTSPHGGGKRLDADSDEYKLIRRWIAAGTPVGKQDDPKVSKISVFPEHRIMSMEAKQQLAVYAHYSNGTFEDVTRRAQYESNETGIATVEGSGLVRTLKQSGEAAVMVRYQEHVTVFRATVPLPTAPPPYEFPEQSLVDRHTLAKWKQLNLAPSALTDDSQFCRRVYLDIAGTMPTPALLKEFVEDKAADKRAKLIDKLLASKEYGYYFANKWADILHVRRERNPAKAPGTFSFHQWIHESIESDKPYDQFARAILTASGSETKCPPVVWYKHVDQPEKFVDDTAQVFLGLRLACANCHHHPYERWSQDDYWGIAAHYGRVGRKNRVEEGDQGRAKLSVFVRSGGQVTNKRTNRPADVKALDSKPAPVESGDDPRERLADWMTDVKNPFFAKAVVNRYWAHFFGRGIVDPLDDMRVTNPPSNPELLDALTKEFVDHKYSLKHLVRVICNSRTYQLSSTPNDVNRHDRQTFARYYPKRLNAEVLLDAVCQVTDSPTQFNGMPTDRHSPKRAIMLPDESFGSYFLDVFGRPQRSSACECERAGDANLAQALHLLNSDEVQGKLARPGARADQLAKDKRPAENKVEELFLWAFGRLPTKEQRDAAINLINKRNDKKSAYEDIIWSLLNTKEFVMNH